MKAFIINLDHAKERWERVEREATTAGFEVHRVPAIFGDDLQEPFYDYSPTGYRLFHGRRTNKREIGCYMSHLRALDDFLETEDEHAVIFEDDVQILPIACEMVRRATEHTNLWDMLRLSGLHSGSPWAVVDLSDEYHLAVNISRQTGAGAYAVNRRCATILTEHLTPMTLPYDHAFDREWALGYKSLSMIPYPVIQNEAHPTSIKLTERYSSLRYLTVFPYRATNESCRIAYRLAQYAKVRATTNRKTA